METQSAIHDFELAIKELSKIRFYEDFYLGNNEWKRDVRVPPRVIEVCRSRPCDAGTDCCHKFVKNNITFCVY